MADTNLGGVYYEVDAKTDGLLNLQNQVNKTTDAIAKDFKQADQAVSVANKSINTNLNKTTVAVGQATGSMSNMRGVAQNLGYQLQDVAIQAQMGTNALVILGQQGSQFLGAFGTAGAVAGSILAISAALGTALLPALFKSNTSASDLEETMKKLSETTVETNDNVRVITKSIEDLAKVSKAAAQAEIAAGLVRAKQAAEQAGKAIQEAFDQQIGAGDWVYDIGDAIRYVNVNTPQATRFMKEFGSELGASSKDAEDLGREVIRLISNVQTLKTPESFKALQDRLAEISTGSGNVSDKMKLLISDLNGFFSQADQAAKATEFLANAQKDLDGALTNSTESAAENITAIARLVQEIRSQAAVVGMTQRGIALYTAEQYGATKADIDSINASFDVIEAYELKKEAIKKAKDEQNEYAKSVEKSFLKELKAEQDQRNKITTEFEQVQKGITADIETPAQKAERELAERLAVIQKYNQLETVEEAKKTQTGVMAQKAYEAQLTKIKKDEEAKRMKMNSDTLGYTADLFGNLAQLAEAGGKKSFNAWKLFASAQAAVNAALAITNVLATVPAPFNFALAGTVAAVTGAQIATINSQSYGGGRLYGGPVQAGTMYPITENGKPEILQQGNKQYLLPGSSGNVISNKDMMAQGGANVSVEVNVQNMNGSQVDVKRSQGPNRKEIIDIIVADIGNRGQTYRAITSTTSARGTTR